VERFDQALQEIEKVRAPWALAPWPWGPGDSVLGKSPQKACAAPWNPHALAPRPQTRDRTVTEAVQYRTQREYMSFHAEDAERHANCPLCLRAFASPEELNNFVAGLKAEAEGPEGQQEQE
jgi:hypothetical protein